MATLNTNERAVLAEMNRGVTLTLPWRYCLRQYIWNSPRARTRLIDAIWMLLKLSVVVWVIWGVGSLVAGKGLAYLYLRPIELSCNGTFLGTLVTFLVGSYWSLDSIFGRQWTYCADVYNAVAKASSKLQSDYLMANLMSDLLCSRLWKHSTFDYMFRTELLHLAEKYDEAKGTSHWRDVEAGKISFDAAQVMLTWNCDRFEEQMRFWLPAVGSGPI